MRSRDHPQSVTKRTLSNLGGGRKLALRPNPRGGTLALFDIPPGGFARTVCRFGFEPRRRLDSPAMLWLNDLSNVRK
jgi:hypothetical protein